MSTSQNTFQGAASSVEEEMNGNGRRIGRPAKLSPSSTPPINETKCTDSPVPPKHIPFPPIPQDGELLFETMSFAFTLVATGLQFLNLYRTVWWLPNSFTTTAMVSVLMFVSFI